MDNNPSSWIIPLAELLEDVIASEGLTDEGVHVGSPEM
jgi:hypothetical protein